MLFVSDDKVREGDVFDLDLVRDGEGFGLFLIPDGNAAFENLGSGELSLINQKQGRFGKIDDDTLLNLVFIADDGTTTVVEQPVLHTLNTDGAGNALNPCDVLSALSLFDD